MTTVNRWNRALGRIAIISAYAATLLVPTGWANPIWWVVIPIAGIVYIGAYHWRRHRAAERTDTAG